MDATHVALILVVVIIVVVLVSRGRRPGGTLTWTFRVPLGQRPKLDPLDIAGLESQGKEGRTVNVVMAGSSVTQLQGEWPASSGSDLTAKETLGQRMLEQLVLPKGLVKDLEVQKLFGQGFAYLQQQDYDRAISVFGKAVNLAHHNLYQPHAKPEIEGKIAAIAHNNLASSLIVKGDVDAAIIEFREGLRLDPTLAGLHDGLGDALLAKGDQNAAAGEFAEAARLDPNLAITHSSLGQALARKGDAGGAAREYRRALNLNPNLADAQEGLRTLQRQPGGTRDAP